MDKQLGFVLGGGGARGALQVGALRALLEAGFQPNLLVGTSAGAINAAFLALYGCSLETVDRLEGAWLEAANLDLLPSNYLWLSLRAALRPSVHNPANRIRDFFVANGVTSELRFADLGHSPLIVVSSDLSSGRPVLHGQGADESVLDALLVSTALPPWSMPVRTHGKYLMDGALVSSLPIEPAMRMGATDLVALDLSDERDLFGQASGFGVFLNKLAYTVERRQVDLELRLAEARETPVFYLNLTSREPVPIWDFRHADELILQGYEIAKSAIAEQHIANVTAAAS